MTPLLLAERIAISRRLKETTFRLEAGELVCLIGPNGSGKTSLLHAVAGVGSPSGSVKVCGMDRDRLHPDQRQRLLAFVPASREVKWPLTASDLIKLGNPIDLHAEPVVEAFELAPFLHRRVDQLSTGERSRVLIARALAADPALLLLDEPIANLDPLWQLRMMDFLKSRVSGPGKGVLVAIHDLSFARAYADKVVVMNNGMIVRHGPSDEIFGSSVIQEIFGVNWTEGRWEIAP